MKRSATGKNLSANEQIMLLSQPIANGLGSLINFTGGGAGTHGSTSSSQSDLKQLKAALTTQ
jgi:hypothetical protein